MEEAAIFQQGPLEDMDEETRNGFMVWGFNGCSVEGNYQGFRVQMGVVWKVSEAMREKERTSDQNKKNKTWPSTLGPTECSPHACFAWTQGGHPRPIPNSCGA